MDIATLIGLLGGFGIIIGAIATGGDIMIFVDVASVLIVVGGTFMVTLMQVSLGDFLGSFAIGMKAFFYKVDDPKQLIEEAVTLADIARKNGLLVTGGSDFHGWSPQRLGQFAVQAQQAPQFTKLLLNA